MTYEAWRISYQSSEQAARAAYAECVRLQVKVAEMERQEPVAEIGQQYTLLFAGSGSITGIVKRHGLKIGDKLYALPGAQPTPSVPEDVMRDARRYRWLRNESLDWYVGPEYSTYNDVVCSGECCNFAGTGIALDARIDAMLAAPEPKP